MDYLIDTLGIYNQAVQAAITHCLAYFEKYKGNTKPNAANLDGIPYHVYEDSWQWQVSPTSTTSECLTLYLRALIACRQFDKAKDIADFILAFLLFDQVNIPHWLIDLTGNTEMETVRLGNVNNAVFAFTNGIATIPADVINYGHKVSHIRGCFSLDAEFAYPDYYLGNTSGIEKAIGHYEVNESGCTIYLSDTSYTGNLQVFYAYYNGLILDQYDLYRTYPRNTKCIVNDEFDYQLSIATDGVQWAIIGLKELAEVLEDPMYFTKANVMIETLSSDMAVAQPFNRLFDATYRGLVWDSVGTYDESGIRFPFLDQVNKHHTRFHFGGDLEKKAVSWAVGKPFSWETNSLLEMTVSGSEFFALRQFILKANSKEYFYPWYDNFTGDKTYSIHKNEFAAIDTSIIDASRAPYLDVYAASGETSKYILSKESYNSTFKDSQGIYYPLWHKLSYAMYKINYNWVVIGAGTPGGVETTSDNDVLKAILAGTTEPDAYYTFEVVDQNDFVFEKEIHLSPTPQEFTIRLGDLRDPSWNYEDFPNHFITHPIKSAGIKVRPLWPYDPFIFIQGNIYIGAIYLNHRDIFNFNQSDFLKFETRQETSGYFDISKAILHEPVEDRYPYVGVPVFTLEYTELGLMAWRSGSYSGYTNPLSWLHSPENYTVAMQFLKDAQNEFQKRFGIVGPFMPIYNRNLTENLVYDDLEVWTFNGPDQNTTWMGFQYRTLVNVAESYYQRLFFGDGVIDQTAKTILDRWVSFLNTWFKSNSHLPSVVYPNGQILYTYQAADFIAQVGRSMMLKYIVDNDLEALQLAQRMLLDLLNLQKENGAFYPNGSNIYNFHQAEALLFLGQWLNNFQTLSDIRRAIMDD